MIANDLLIFGAGSHARRLATALRLRNHQVHAFMTSRPTSVESIDGTPVHCIEWLPEELRKIDAVAVGVFNRSDSYQEISQTIGSHGFAKIHWPWDYYPHLHDFLGWCYWLNPEPKRLSEWRQDSTYVQLASLLADDESRELVDRILAFRAGDDLSFSGFQSNESQYFNHLTLSALADDAPVAYLDVGAFNGDTLQHLCLHAQVSSAALLEPDPRNYKSLVANLSSLVDTYPQLCPLALPLGAGNEYGTFFLSGEGEAVTLQSSHHDQSANYDSAIVVRIDDLLPAQTFDFVKIDVEGHDRDAIEGMQTLLRRSTPVICVSLYHRPHDIIHLPLYLAEVLKGLDYQYFIRQHMFNSFETVLYAIPANK